MAAPACCSPRPATAFWTGRSKRSRAATTRTDTEFAYQLGIGMHFQGWHVGYRYLQTGDLNDYGNITQHVLVAGPAHVVRRRASAGARGAMNASVVSRFRAPRDSLRHVLIDSVLAGTVQCWPRQGRTPILPRARIRRSRAHAHRSALAVNARRRAGRGGRHRQFRRRPPGPPGPSSRKAGASPALLARRSPCLPSSRTPAKCLRRPMSPSGSRPSVSRHGTLPTSASRFSTSRASIAPSPPASPRPSSRTWWRRESAPATSSSVTTSRLAAGARAMSRC